MRLTILYGLTQSRRLGKKKLKEAKYVFQEELDEYIANGSLGPQRPTWDPDGRESVLYHYGRLLALTVAVEFASGDPSTEVAKAIREEARGLCESYFRWCDHILSPFDGERKGIHINAHSDKCHCHKDSEFTEADSLVVSFGVAIVLRHRHHL